MAATTTSNETAASALDGTELVRGVQSAANVKVTIAQIKTWCSNAPALVAPALGTPSSGVLSGCTGYAQSALTGLGSNVSTALAIAVGSAGAPVTNGGALGTPSSGVGTNITGVNAATLGGATFAAPGTIGGTTPAAGAFTTLNATIGPTAMTKFSATVDFNVANTDTAITITLPTGITRYAFNAIFISGASASLTTATVGVFTAAAGGGTAVVTAASAITVSTASESTTNNTQSLTLNNNGAISYSATTIYVRVATAQGSAATGTVTLNIRPLS